MLKYYKDLILPLAVALAVGCSPGGRPVSEPDTNLVSEIERYFALPDEVVVKGRYFERDGSSYLEIEGGKVMQMRLNGYLTKAQVAKMELEPHPFVPQLYGLPYDCSDAVILGDGEVRDFYGYESLTVSDLESCPVSVERGQVVPLDIRHTFTTYGSTLPSKEFIDESLRRGEVFPRTLKPLISDSFGRVAEIRGKVVRSVWTTPYKTYVVSVLAKEGEAVEIDCLIPESKQKQIEGLFEAGEELTLLGYEIPYATTRIIGGTVFWETNEPERIVGKTVFLVCQAEAVE